MLDQRLYDEAWFWCAACTNAQAAIKHCRDSSLTCHKPEVTVAHVRVWELTVGPGIQLDQLELITDKQPSYHSAVRLLVSIRSNKLHAWQQTMPAFESLDPGVSSCVSTSL